ncbi:MAG: shikimate dehydrogenase family protein, partial [Bifidobacterium sp.]|uniref:shikimate dehydrogenase family protein n=1 Tax=Bifidobacterium sp. TaxID=41200 RepID=UPI003F0555D7
MTGTRGGTRMMDIEDSAGAPITGNQCAVLGKPIRHSLSPTLHQAAYRALGLADTWSYHRYEIDEDHLGLFLSGLDSSWRGLSLTMPLKRTIQPYGIPSNMWARRLAVANTVVFDWDEPGIPGPARDHGLPLMRLYNTDVDGIDLAIRHAWQTAGTDMQYKGRDMRALVIGNGNTAMSAIAALSQLSSPEGAPVRHITVAARHPEHNADIVALAEHRDSGRLSDIGIDVDIIALDRVLEIIADCDIVISTLPSRAADPIADAMDEAGATAHGTLLDVAYDPRPSALHRAWSQAGGLSVGGEDMLLYQAIGQVCLMTGRGAERWNGDQPAVVEEVDAPLEDA